MTKEELIDEIFTIRVRNNVPWKKLMLAALKYAPPDVVANIVHQINENDLQVAHLMSELEKHVK
jgi:hypothetical protein